MGTGIKQIVLLGLLVVSMGQPVAARVRLSQKQKQEARQVEQQAHEKELHEHELQIARESLQERDAYYNALNMAKESAALKASAYPLTKKAENIALGKALMRAGHEDAKGDRFWRLVDPVAKQNQQANRLDLYTKLINKTLVPQYSKTQRLKVAYKEKKKQGEFDVRYYDALADMGAGINQLAVGVPDVRVRATMLEVDARARLLERQERA